MAEYKGLTIRIGGDTSQLNSALKASTKAASSLQSQIRQITRAMRFDPGNMANIDTRMRLTTDRAEALYSKLELLRNGYKELGNSIVAVGGTRTSVKDLAESTENVALAASTAKERYNDMTASLAANYRELEARAKEAGQAMNLNALSRQGSEETFEKQMAQLKELGVITDEEIDRLRTMRATWNEAFESSEAYKAAAQLEGMSVDMQRVESEARSATATVRELGTASKYSADAWGESTARIKSMDSALTECTKQAKAYEAALREDPSNLSAALGRLKALSNEYDLAEAKASELSRQVEAYKGRLSGVLAEHRNLPQYIQETGDEWQKVNNELLEAKGKSDTLHKSLQKMKDSLSGGANLGELLALDKLEREVREADARVEELRRDAEKMDAAFETAKECSELQRLQRELAETTARAKSLKERMDLKSLGGRSFLNASTIKSAGMSMYSTLTPAITMLGWRAVTAAQDIDSAYRDMRKTVEGTESQFAALKDAAIEFSKTHVTSADQILNIMAIGGELGIATESLEAFAETVSNLDVATNLDTEQAASSLGKLANITHMTAEQYDNYADALVRLGNNGASTEDQIVDITTRIGSMGTIVGMSVPEILALSSSIASTGMKTEAAGTAIANTISDMESAVASGGEALDAFASVSQMSSEEFAEAWENEPIVAFQAFIEGLNEIEKSGGSADATLEAMGITGTRQKNAIEGLMQTIGGLNDNLAMSRNAWNGQSDAWGMAGDAAREAEKKAEGFSGQLAILSNIGNDAMAALAEGATPIISLLTNLARSALDLFEQMDEGSRTVTVAFLGIGAAIGPLFTLAATFMTAKQNIHNFVTESSAMGKAMKIIKEGFTDTSNGVSDMGTKMMSVKEAAKELGKSLLKNLAMAGVVAGITVAISLISDYIRKMQEFKTATQNAGDTLSSVFAGISSDAEGAFGDTAKSFDDMVSEFAKHNETIRKSAEDTYGNAALVEDYGNALKDALSAYNEGDRSEESLAKLKTALDLYNGAAGESITLTENETGALQLMKDDAVLTADAFDTLSQSIINASKAKFFEEAYSQKYADEREALDALTAAQKRADDARTAYQDNTDPQLTDALRAEYEAANNELARSKELYDATAASAAQYKEGMELMTEAQLENASGAVQWVAGNDALQAAIWQNNESVTGFAHALGNLNLDYDTLSANSSVIEEMGAAWDGTLASLIPGMQELGIQIDSDTASMLGLSEVQVGDKTFLVSDDGTILDESGKVMALNNMLIGDKVYSVDDNGTIWDGINAVGTLSNDIAHLPNGSVRVQATTDQATGAVTGWVAKTNSMVSTIKIDGNASAADDKVKSAVDSANRSTGTIGVNANTYNFYQSVRNIDGKTVGTAYVNIRGRGGSYMGGYSQTPWDLSSAYVLRMATGAIVTGPLLTNNGWIGEDGAEAVLSWGTGGAVVPLTNHKYMEPIAEAIARNMPAQSGMEPVSVSVTVNARTDADPNEIAAVTARKVKQIFMARGR